MIDPSPVPLFSDEPTIELVVRAKTGDRDAVEALLRRCLPRLQRWAHGRLPAASRSALDTGDLVQEVAISVLTRLEQFEPRNVGGMQAYLRQAVINRIRDEVRRVSRRPTQVEIPEDAVANVRSPLESAIETETYERYRDALTQLSQRERELVVGRIEMQWSYEELAHQLGLPTAGAARLAVTRALRKLTERLQPDARSRR